MPAAARQKKRKMDDHFIYIPPRSGCRYQIDSSEGMRTKLFYPAIDIMIAEMTARFCVNEPALLGINACDSGSEIFLEVKHLQDLATNYKLDFFDMKEPLPKTL